MKTRTAATPMPKRGAAAPKAVPEPKSNVAKGARKGKNGDDADKKPAHLKRAASKAAAPKKKPRKS